MALWKQIKENRLERAAKARKGRKSIAKPESILIWIDSAYNDQSARLVRAIALAEGFQKSGINHIVLACPESQNLPEESEKRHIQWVDSRPGGDPLPFFEIVKASNADLAISDCFILPRHSSDETIPYWVLLCDVFSRQVFDSDAIQTYLMPGWILAPDFERLDLPPSRLGNCLHGVDYVPIPTIYYDEVSSPIEPDRLLIALSGHVNLESLRQLLDAIRNSWKDGVCILADVNSKMAPQIREKIAGNIELLIDPPWEKRLKAIRRAKLVLAYPSLNVYEFFAMCKPMILMPRNRQEALLCRMVLEQEAARAVPAEEMMDLLKPCIDDLLRSEGERARLIQRMKSLITPISAQNVAHALLARYARCGSGPRML
ncbi:MAG: hypothetical protein JXR73_14595 [Candidatus Omnitrophica bacterium]|nr:hypothetical protein [Candidatus Omnitrophota bacterium]